MVISASAICLRDRVVVAAVIVIMSVIVFVAVILVFCVARLLKLGLYVMICLLSFFFVSFSFPVCRLSENDSIGLIDVAYREPLLCLWSIGNVGIANAVAVFIIQRVIISSCRYLELTELFSLGFPFSHLRARSSV